MQGNYFEMIEEPESANFGRWLRASFERLLFTDRGRFATVLGMLLVTYANVSTVFARAAMGEGFVPTDTTVQGVTIPVSVIETAMAVSHGGMVVLLAALVGLTALLFIDGYEYHFGTIYDDE